MAVAYVNAGTRSNSAGATSRAPALPASRVNGNFLIAVVGAKNNDTHSVSGAGWSKWGQVNSGTGWTVSLHTCVVNGSEGTPTISWTNSVACFGQIYQFSGTTANAIGAYDSNTGTGSTHSRNAITTTSNNSMVIYIDAAAANTALAQPSGWTERSDNGSATGATRNALGDKTITTSGSSSGNISVTGANAAWVMWQIELLVPITGSASMTVDAITSSGSGAVTLAGSASLTVDAATLSGAGTVALTGAASMTLNAVTLSATGQGLPEISGEASLTIADIGASGAGALNITGAAALTVADVSASGAGAVSLTGACASVVDAIWLSGAGALNIAGAAALTVADVSMSGAGAVQGSEIFSAGAMTLDAVTVSGSGYFTVNGRYMGRAKAVWVRKQGRRYP